MGERGEIDVLQPHIVNFTFLYRLSRDLWHGSVIIATARSIRNIDTIYNL